MHFPIIELKPARVPKDERMSGYEIYDDSCASYFTDYIGDGYSESERREFLRNGRLQELLEGIATVNTRGSGSITFLDADTIRATVKKQVRETFEKMLQKMDKEPVRPNDIAYAGEYWRDDEMMFHYESCCHTSGNFISDAVWYAGKTLYIGGIMDAHI